MRPAEHRELLRALGIVPDEEPDEREEAGPVEFDEGVRRSAPPPADSEAEHGQTVLQIIQEARWGRSNL